LESQGPSRDVRGLFICRDALVAGARGFSLVELLAVIAMTLLIGAVATSAYRTYVVRAKIAAAVIGAAGIQSRVVSAFERDGTPPLDRRAAGLADSGTDPLMEYVESVEIVNGRIELRFGGKADEAIEGNVLSLTPFETAEQDVVWVCGNRAPGVGLQPLGFMNGTGQATQVLTMIDPRYLPATCR
jgi:type IV pilus assembly protein PilA